MKNSTEKKELKGYLVYHIKDGKRIYGRYFNTKYEAYERMHTLNALTCLKWRVEKWEE